MPTFLHGLTDDEILAKICPCGNTVKLLRGKYICGSKAEPYGSNITVMAICPSCDIARWEGKKFDRRLRPSVLENQILEIRQVDLPEEMVGERVAARPIQIAKETTRPEITPQMYQAARDQAIYERAALLNPLVSTPRADSLPSSSPPLSPKKLSAAPVAAELDDPSVYLGEIVQRIESFESDALALQETEEAVWRPHHPEKPLNNASFLCVGGSGSGKTQVLKAVIDELARQKVAITIFDFKNDYSDTAFTNSSSRPSIEVYDINKNGLPFNPLQLVADEENDCQPIRSTHELVAILARILSLGAQQAAHLRKAIVKAYEDKGIDPKATYKWAQLKQKKFPSFSDVQKNLAADEDGESVLNKLAFIFDLNIFPETSKVSFEDLIKKQVVLDFHKLPNDSVKALVAEFIIVRLHSYLIKNAQPRKLRFALFFDEAWRVKESERLQELAREGRAFGVGLIIATQYPGDINEVLAGSLATQLYLHNSEAEHQKMIARALVGASSGPAATSIIKMVANLQKHEGILKSQQYSPAIIVKTLPYYKRVECLAAK